MIPDRIETSAELAAAFIKEDVEFLEKRLTILNARPEAPQRWYMVFVDGGVGVGQVAVTNFGPSRGEFLHFWGTNQEKATVEVIMHVNQLRISLVTVPLEKAPEKRKIGFGVPSE